jgi:crotonobetainyl-CoA:carnitine CoA-transferase CaiB-like acyl-CoA transferase
MLVALLAAQRSGEGRWVDVAMTEALLVHHYFPHAELDAGRIPVAGSTLLTGGAACYRVYETADRRHLAVGALESKFWERFCAAIGLPELRTNHWSHGEVPGSDAAGPTIDQVVARIRGATLDDWTGVFAAVDACVAPVLSPAEALEHEQVVARGVVRRRGRVTEVGPLARISGHTLQDAPAPRVGEHTRMLLAELGLEEREIGELLSLGVVRSAA